MAQPDQEIVAGLEANHKEAFSLEHSSMSDKEMNEGTTSSEAVAEDPTAAPAAAALPAQPTGFKLALIIASVCLAVFIQALDNTIISTAIPRITNQFHSLGDVGWYASAYFLTTCACQLFWGRIYTFFHLKAMYMTSIIFFEIGSLICATAPNSTALIVGRAIAGFGSAGIFSGSFIIIAFSVPLQKRPLYTGLLGVMYGVASVVGPLVGGAFTDNATWRWCFYINLPLGGIVLSLIFFFFKSPAQNSAMRKLPFKQKLSRFDLIGTVLFLATIICLLLALQWGGTTYAWSSGRIIALLVLFGVGILAWIGVQYSKGADAMVPGRIIFQRSIGFAALNAFCIGGAFFLLIYFVPIWLQAVHGDTAILSGVHTLPMLLGVTVAEVFTAIGVNRLGYYTPFMLASVVLTATGIGLITTWNPATSSGHWIGFQALFGLGMGMGWQQPLLVVQTVLTHADIPTGTAVMLLFQLFGGTMFVSVAQNVFSNRLLSNLAAANIPGVDSQALLAAGATGFRSVVPAQQLGTVLVAYSNAITQAFYVSLALSCIAIVGAAGVEWKSVKAKRLGGTK